MTRDVDLVSYLPPFLAEFKENTAALEAENPEFTLLWDASNRVLKNEFIATADEYGISRFEKILKILPSTEDTLESRRSRVQARWFNTIPYTMKAFIAKLIALCNDKNFTITKKYEIYKVEILTELEMFGQVAELEHMIENMMPCNIIIVSNNEIPCKTGCFAFIGGGIVAVEHFFITNDFKENNSISGDSVLLGGVVSSENVFITNDFEEGYSVEGSAALRGGAINTSHYFITNDSEEAVSVSGTAESRGGVVNTATVVITNDFNEQFNINGENAVGSGVVVSEIVEINSN